MMRNPMMILLTVFLLFAAPVACNFRPLVMIHGLGGHYTCFDNLTEMVKLDFPGIQTFSIDSFNEDDSWAPIIQQIVRISELVDRITQKYGNITLLGFSQGGFIARGVLQMSDNPYIHTLISISAPAMGQYGQTLLPKGQTTDNDTMSQLCFQADGDGQALSTCGWWKDPRPHYYQHYLGYSTILPYLNNEVLHYSSARYKQNFLRVSNMVMVASESDGVITPWQSSQYGFFNADLELLSMRDTDLYKNDTFGLRTLDESQRFNLCTLKQTKHNMMLSDKVYQRCIKQYI